MANRELSVPCLGWPAPVRSRVYACVRVNQALERRVTATKWWLDVPARDESQWLGHGGGHSDAQGRIRSEQANTAAKRVKAAEKARPWVCSRVFRACTGALGCAAATWWGDTLDGERDGYGTKQWRACGVEGSSGGAISEQETQRNLRCTATIRSGSLLTDGSGFAATTPWDDLPASFSSSSLPLTSAAAGLGRNPRERLGLGLVSVVALIAGGRWRERRDGHCDAWTPSGGGGHGCTANLSMAARRKREGKGAKKKSSGGDGADKRAPPVSDTDEVKASAG
jgi:hypothetical protein